MCEKYTSISIAYRTPKMQGKKMAARCLPGRFWC
uniref:Uncharacterized protein n=1 Tax=Anguilla anguilla TaxID=7936 RepID=A0A0E9W310_ANGAN